MIFDTKTSREVNNLMRERERLKHILWSLGPEQDGRLLEARIAAIEARIEALMQKPSYKDMEG